jgi:serine/threonine protein kinase
VYVIHIRGAVGIGFAHVRCRWLIWASLHFFFCLRSGKFSVVRVGIAKTGAALATSSKIAIGTKVAVKCILKQGCPAPLLIKEVEIMRRIGNHSGVIQLYDVYEDSETVYLILELVTGGELFDKIVTTDVYSEKMAANYIRQVVEVVAFLHDNLIVHRDLKPENLLLEDSTAEKLKVCDFGLAEILDPPEELLFMVVGRFAPIPVVCASARSLTLTHVRFVQPELYGPRGHVRWRISQTGRYVLDWSHFIHSALWLPAHRAGRRNYCFGIPFTRLGWN